MHKYLKPQAWICVKLRKCPIEMQSMRYKDCVEYIRSDYFRITGRKGDGMFKMSLKGILDTGFRFLFWFRLAKCSNILVVG